MTALSQDRMTPQRSGDNRTLPIKAATKVYAGSMGAIDANGLLVPMSTSTTLKGVGRVERTVNNAGANGALSADVKPGIFRWGNSSAGDLITLADIGNDCYGVDDQTVAKTNGGTTRSVAGKIHDVDAQGVWVKFS
jgi:hypothetical protein